MTPVGVWEPTRAYIQNENAHELNGFVLPFDFMKFIKEADQDGKLNHSKKWQDVEYDKI